MLGVALAEEDDDMEAAANSLEIRDWLLILVVLAGLWQIGSWLVKYLRPQRFVAKPWPKVRGKLPVQKK
jgi:hypothetical protein